jgi:type IV secretion system protein VirB6
MMALVMSVTRVAIIVIAATTMSMFGASLHHFFTTDLSTEVNHLFTGDNSTTAQTIDDNLAWTQLALGAIDTVKIGPGDAETIDQKNHAMMLASFGTASPPMAAAAMLLLYQFTLAIFIGLGPLFILCLIFEQTKSLFQRWLLYGIGTLFSVAVLYVVTSIVLKLTINVAAALWSASIVNHILDTGSEGFSSQALQQGGIGLLLTVLIVSVPPMAAMFFQGTLGNFLTYSAFGMGSTNRLGPQGQPPGSYGGFGGGAYGRPIADGANTNVGLRSKSGDAFGGGPNVGTLGTRGTVVAGPGQLDAIKPQPVGRS